jgi:hypothetical protein
MVVIKTGALASMASEFESSKLVETDNPVMGSVTVHDIVESPAATSLPPAGIV